MFLPADQAATLLVIGLALSRYRSVRISKVPFSRFARVVFPFSFPYHIAVKVSNYLEYQGLEK
jgi:hypothetical protein